MGIYMSKFLVWVFSASSYNCLIQFGVEKDLRPDTNWKCHDSSLIKQSVSLKLKLNMKE